MVWYVLFHAWVVLATQSGIRTHSSYIGTTPNKSYINTMLTYYYWNFPPGEKLPLGENQAGETKGASEHEFLLQGRIVTIKFRLQVMSNVISKNYGGQYK